jgi:hypothetical protein
MKNLECIPYKEHEILLSFFQNDSKEFDNLRLLDLTKASPNIVENFIQGQDLNFFQLSALQSLYLSRCSSLQKLHTFVGQLNALQNLDL